MFYFEDAINDSRYNNTFFYVGMKKKDSNKIKNIPFTIDNVLNNNYLTNFIFDTEYDYYISTNTFKNMNSKSNENLFSIQMLTIDVD